MNFDDDLTAEVKRLAGECGFARAGVAPVGEIQSPERLKRWVADGLNAGMDYLTRNLSKRLCPGRLVEGARSVLCLLVSYNPDKEIRSDAFIARYARGRDYHKVLRKRTRLLCDRIRLIAPSFAGRVFVDTAPVAERSLAAAAGLGWIGRNGALIVPDLGSYVLLGEIICNLPLRPDDPLSLDCGDCTACQSACPTGAIVAEKTVDARRCLSYHTIENRGEIPRELWRKLGNRVFGCDTCQAVCPHNLRCPPGDGELLAPSGNRRVPARGGTALTLEQILQWRRGDWDVATRGSAMRRATWSMFLRNAVIAAGNIGDHSLLDPLSSFRGRVSERALLELIDWAAARISESGNNEV